tara:strand:- start:3331 stop:3597 length:267 start_codon:yes stop_codon:yes gene_type:complete
MKAFIIVQNLKCGGCAKTITSKLTDLNSITDVFVDVETSTVSFEHRDIKDALLAKVTLKSIGYPSIAEKNGLADKTRSLVSCATGKLK